MGGAVVALACGGKGTEGERAARAGGSPAESTTVTTNAAPGRVQRVLILGTSLTAGLGLPPDSAYPAVVQRIADSVGVPVRIQAAGLSGETSAGALRRADWLLTQPADVYVLETGANDGLRGLDPDSTAANLRAILRKMRAANPQATLVLAQMEAPTNLGAAYTRRFHALFGTVAKEEGVVLMPFFLEGVAGVDSLNQDDGIHPNAQGARLAARAVWRTLAPVLDSLRGAAGGR